MTILTLFASIFDSVEAGIANPIYSFKWRKIVTLDISNIEF